MWELEGRLSYTAALKASILILLGFYFLRHIYKAKKAFASYYTSCDAHIRCRDSFFPCSLHSSTRKRSEQWCWPPFSLCLTSQYGLCPDLTDDLFLKHAPCAKSGTESMPKKCRCTSAKKLSEPNSAFLVSPAHCRAFPRRKHPLHVLFEQQLREVSAAVLIKMRCWEILVTNVNRIWENKIKPRSSD